MVKERSKVTWLLLLWPLSAVLLLLCRLSPGFAEYIFARGIYRYYHTALAALSGMVPFSLVEILLYPLVVGGLGMLGLWLVRLVRGKGRRGRRLKRGAFHILCLGGVIFFLFVLGCGGNYYRATYAECTGLELVEATDQDLYDLCVSLTHRANTVRDRLSDCEDENGVFQLPYSEAVLKEEARRTMTAMGKDVAVLSGYYARPKGVLWSRELSRFGITGIFTPFTVEANVNMDAPASSIGAAMCHELGHMAGFMREDEANFIAYLATTGYGDDVLSYSGLRLALSYAGSALYKSDPAFYYQVAEQYSDALIRDMTDSRDYWAQFEDTATAQLGESINDAYLKANAQPQGTESYGAMVELLLSDFLQNKE